MGRGREWVEGKGGRGRAGGEQFDGVEVGSSFFCRCGSIFGFGDLALVQ